jgi:hypothetical protein
MAEPAETVPCEQDCAEANDSDTLKNCKIFDLNKQTGSMITEHRSGGEQNVKPVMCINSGQASELHRTLSDIDNINKPSLESKAIETVEGADAAGTAAKTNEKSALQHRHEAVDVMECGSGLTNTASDEDSSDKTVYVSEKLNNFKTDNASEVYPSVAGDSRRTFQCPLCWKTFEKNEAQVVHMKACASRHCVTTRQLLDAVELQERQAAERQALGLPDIPATRTIKKSSSKKVIYGSLI